MNLDHQLPAQSFTTAELHEIAVAFSMPAVKKYLRNEQAVCFKDIANGLPREGETDAAYLRRQALVVGALNVWEALLQIQKPTEPGSTQS